MSADQPQPPPGDAPPSTPPAALDTPERPARRRVDRRVGRFALLGLLALLGVAMVPILKPFAVSIVVAVCFTTIFYPLFRRVNRLVRGHTGIASLLCCGVLLVGLLIPAYLLVHLVAVQSIGVYNSAEPWVRDVVQKGSEGPVGKLMEQPAVRWLRLQQVDWPSVLQQAASAAGKAGSWMLNKTSASLFLFVANLFVVLFTMFYLFRDGERLLSRLRYLSPLRDEYEEMLMQRFLMISRAAVKGTLLVGLIQGTLGGLTFLVFGIKTWLIWGFVMVLLSIIPFTGAWMIMVPAAIVQMVLGNIGQGVGILVVCLAVVSTVDNLLRPRLVGTAARMHDLLIFFSTLGGIVVFGVMGFIVGPVVAALFVTVLEIYALEYREQLERQETTRA